MTESIDKRVKKAHQAFLEMSKIKGIERSLAVSLMASKLEDCFDDILQANTLDLEISREMSVPDLILDWLKLTPQRLEAAVEILKTLAELPDPFQKSNQCPLPSNLLSKLFPVDAPWGNCHGV